MSDYFPPEMIDGILLHLPAKSLLRFLAVDRTFNSLINTPKFIASHLKLHSHHSHSNPPMLLIHQSSSSSSNTSSSSTKWFFYPPPISQLLHPIPYLNLYTFRFIETIHGLVCLLQQFLGVDCSIILWNPCVGKHLSILPPSSQQNAMGFAFDGDFKVIRFSHPSRVELYSLADNAWRNVYFPNLAEEFGDDVLFSDSQCFLRSDVHWIVKREPSRRNISTILMFNVEEERFREVGFPPRLVRVALSKVKLAVIDNCLSVLHYCSDMCNVWSMAEHGMASSWTKSGKVDLPDGGEVFGLKSSKRVLTTWSNWEGKEFRSLHALDLNNQEMTDLKIKGTTHTACEYSGSLVLLDKA